MLRLNRMTDYAIIVLNALARRRGETLATGYLADLTGLAQPTVAKVSKMLLAAGLVETQRGVRGGYRLTKTLAQISLVDIVEAMEGPILVTARAGERQDPTALSDNGAMSRHWNHVNLAIRTALKDVTLEDLTKAVQIFPLPDRLPLMKDDQRFAS
jgi:FeS assembly SUF system regulator